MSDKMITYVDSEMSYAIKIILSFDDKTTQEATYKIGDEISINYIKDKAMTSIHGILKKIISLDSKVLVIDASTEFHNLVENISINNIRKLNPVEDPLIVVRGAIAHDGTTGPTPMIVERLAIFTGNIPYLTEDLVHGVPAGNRIGVKVTAPEAVTDISNATLFIDGVEKFSFMTGRYFVSYFNATSTDQIFEIKIQWAPNTVAETYNVVIADATLLPAL